MYSSTELVRAAGCTRKTLRVLEEKGLIARATDRGLRRYDEDSLSRLRLLLGLRAMGMSLDEVRDILAIRESDPHDAGHVSEDLANRVDDLVIRLRDHIAELVRLRNRLIVAQATLRDCTTCERSVAACGGCADNGRLDSVSRVLLAGRGAGMSADADKTIDNA